ncbi:GNAT family N-acetyltransferase [Ancylobacter rudongensis]|uniref:Ribosomal protein S18 acetylase RimI n=1 Tax=Ancylobacter rudongensis TaxID=177413 RepID=A0A1G4T8X4_9HYPH|nr:GNAT family N-acetyltransferase [Ancylobacter rudongensis]SCW77883.1 Ribosomal protein S18 acetylase RimI [Ancylobacter rudongensis]
MEDVEAPTIRPIERDDLAAVADMIAQLADHVRPGFTPGADAASLERYGPTGLGLFEAVIATRPRGPVGLCLYTYAFSGWRGRPGVFVEDLYVAPAERGSGLGRALLAAVIAREAPKGCSFIKLHVDKANAGAQAFYARLGFVPEAHDDTLTLEEEGLRAISAPV